MASFSKFIIQKFLSSSKKSLFYYFARKLGSEFFRMSGWLHGFASLILFGSFARSIPLENIFTMGVRFNIRCLSAFESWKKLAGTLTAWPRCRLPIIAVKRRSLPRGFISSRISLWRLYLDFVCCMSVLFRIAYMWYFKIRRVIFQITNPLCVLHKLEIIIS